MSNAGRIRGRFTAPFKAEVALAALQEQQPLAALGAQYQLTPAPPAGVRFAHLARRRRAGWRRSVAAGAEG